MMTLKDKLNNDDKGHDDSAKNPPQLRLIS